jgi:hypothetical protein
MHSQNIKNPSKCLTVEDIVLLKKAVKKAFQHANLQLSDSTGYTSHETILGEAKQRKVQDLTTTHATVTELIQEVVL